MTKDHELIIIVTYTGLKATQYFSKQSSIAVTQLKKDLTELKFPLPKNQNVSFVSHGCMKAFWIAPLNSHVYRCLHAAVNKEPVGDQVHFSQRLGIKKILLDTHLYRPWSTEEIAPSTRVLRSATRSAAALALPSQDETRQQVQDVAPLASSGIKRAAPQDGESSSLGSNKRVRVGPFGPPMYKLPVVLPPVRFGATAAGAGAAQIGGTAWLPQSQLSFGPPPSTLSMQMLTQWNRQQTQVPGTLGQTPPSAAVKIEAQTQINLQQTTGNSSVPQAQIHQFRSLPNPEGQAPAVFQGRWGLNASDEHAGVAATAITTQPNGAQMESRIVPQVQARAQQPQGSQTPQQRTHTSSASGGSTSAAMATTSNPAPVSDQMSPISGNVVPTRPNTTPATTNGSIQTSRLALELQLQQYQQTKSLCNNPQVVPLRFNRISDLQKKAPALEEAVEKTRQKLNLVQGTLGVAQQERKNASDELQEARKSRMEVEEQLSSERARLAQINEELRKERTLRAEAEAQLHNERKGREEVDEELQKERKVRTEAEGFLRTERQGRAGIDTDLQKERRLRAEVEAQLLNERKGRAEIDEELQKERTIRTKAEGHLQDERQSRVGVITELQQERRLRVEVEAQLLNERKGRAEVDEELQKERMIRMKAEGHLQDERQGRAGVITDLQQERRLRAEAEARLQDERKGRAEIDAELQAERKSRIVVAGPRVEFEIGELKQEDPWDQLEDERNKRLKMEEKLGEERRRRVEAEQLLEDVERECRAPFVVPALLEAFGTISRVTSRALEAKASHI